MSTSAYSSMSLAVSRLLSFSFSLSVTVCLSVCLSLPLPPPRRVPDGLNLLCCPVQAYAVSTQHFTVIMENEQNLSHFSFCLIPRPPTHTPTPNLYRPPPPRATHTANLRPFAPGGSASVCDKVPTLEVDMFVDTFFMASARPPSCRACGGARAGIH